MERIGRTVAGQTAPRQEQQQQQQQQQFLREAWEALKEGLMVGLTDRLMAQSTD
jgi:hypothetical protein